MMKGSEKESEMVRVSLELSSREETTEKTSVAKASIILMLLRWEEIVDLTSRCAVCNGIARVGQRRVILLNLHE